jgi:hypothetical protein
MFRVIVESYFVGDDDVAGAVQHDYLQSFEDLDLPALIRYLNPGPDEVKWVAMSEAELEAGRKLMGIPRPVLPEES